MEFLTSIENKLDEYFVQKGPVKIPDTSKKSLAIILPILAIIAVISSAIIILVSGIGGIISLVTFNGILLIFLLLVIAIQLIQLALNLYSLYSGLFRYTKKAWTFFFYGQLASIVGLLINSLKDISQYGITGIVSAFFGIVFGCAIYLVILYFTFQVKSEFVN